MIIPEIKEGVRQVKAGEVNLIDVRTPEEYEIEHPNSSIFWAYFSSPSNDCSNCGNQKAL